MQEKIQLSLGPKKAAIWAKYFLRDARTEDLTFQKRLEMGLPSSFNNAASSLKQKSLEPGYRDDGITQHPPSLLTTKRPWSEVFHL